MGAILTLQAATEADQTQARLDRAQRVLAEQVADAMYSTGPEVRVAELRASVLGTEAAPRLIGFAAALRTHEGTI